MLWPTLLAVAATVYLVVRIVLTLRARDARSRGRYEITPVPPPELTPATAARLLREVDDRTGISAEILDLAVQGVWQLDVREVDGTPTWAVQRGRPYESILDTVPQTVYRGVFSRGDMTLSRVLVPDAQRTAIFTEALATARTVAERRGWIQPHRQRHLVLNLLGQGLVAAAIVIPAASAFVRHGTLVDPAGPEGLPLIVYAGVVGVAAQFAGIRPWTLTAEGRRLVERLEGVRGYLTLAEAERRAAFGLLPVETHEKLLPYAALFGVLPEWLDVLRADYARTGRSPGWVTGGGLDAVATASVFASLEGVGGFRRLGA